MPPHFEDLWNQCEDFHKESASAAVPNIIEELVMKLHLYQAIDSKAEIPMEDRRKVKSRLLGEVLLTLTELSWKDNVNVYEALNMALMYRGLEHHHIKTSII